MRNDIFSPVIGTDNSEPLFGKKTTTLLIKGVPSQLAYDIYISALKKGEEPSEKQINESVKAIIGNGEPVETIGYSTLIEYIKNAPNIADINNDIKDIISYYKNVDTSTFMCVYNQSIEEDTPSRAK